MAAAAYRALPLLLLLAGCPLSQGSPDARRDAEKSTPCQTVAECPPPRGPCVTASCVDGACRTDLLAAGVLPSAQRSGDCKQVVCDGRGQAITRADPTDEPKDDGNDCTAERCAGDEPEHAPLDAGTRCSHGVCNGAGACGSCVPGATRCFPVLPPRRGGPHALGRQTCDASSRWQDDACPAAAPVCGRGACTAVVDVVLGDTTLCARLADGGLRCSGRDDGGVVRGTTSGRVRVLAHGAEEVAVGLRHACARLADGTVTCWGENTHGALGDGTRNWSARPVLVAGVAGAVQIAAGVAHTCARLADGAVTCWGLNHRGQLGGGASGPRDPARVDVAPAGSSWVDTYAPGPFVGLAVAGQHACARLEGGAVECWGAAAAARADPIEPPRAVPGARPEARRVPGLKGAVDIATGDAHTCARLADGGVVCWGAGESGQLGGGASVDRAAPVRVRGLDPAIRLALGRAHTCALLQGGRVACWGAGENGQLGDGSQPTHAHPVLVPGLADVAAVAARGDVTCALTTSGRVFCWGGANRGTPAEVRW